MGEERKREEAWRDTWDIRLLATLAKLQLDPPAEREPEKKDTNFYCTVCDSGYCTCKKEKQ